MSSTAGPHPVHVVSKIGSLCIQPSSDKTFTGIKEKDSELLPIQTESKHFSAEEFRQAFHDIKVESKKMEANEFCEMQEHHMTDTPERYLREHQYCKLQESSSHLVVKQSIDDQNDQTFSTEFVTHTCVQKTDQNVHRDKTIPVPSFTETIQRPRNKAPLISLNSSYFLVVCGKPPIVSQPSVVQKLQRSDIISHSNQGSQVEKSYETPQRSGPDPVYLCKICDKVFSTYNQKRAHKYVHEGKKYKCNVCPKAFCLQYQLNQHSVFHSEKNYKCPTCGKVFKVERYYMLHMKTHQGSFRFTCDICGKGCSTKQAVKAHQNSMHFFVSHKCTVCNKAFKDITYFKHHMKTHDADYREVTYKCEKCAFETKAIQSYRRHRKKHIYGPRGFMCDICGKQLTSPGSLSDHLMIHSGEKPFVCETCGKSFNKRNLLVTHIRVHTKEKPYPCKFCGRKFSQLSSVRIHIKSIHTGEKSHKCDICDKCFTTKTMMKLHSKKHGTPLAEISTGTADKL